MYVVFNSVTSGHPSKVATKGLQKGDGHNRWTYEKNGLFGDISGILQFWNFTFYMSKTIYEIIFFIISIELKWP